MGRQGCYLDQEEVEQIVLLLETTELTLGEIAVRMSCGKSAVCAINRKRKVRNYRGHRTSWYGQDEMTVPASVK
jgi:ribosomal protein S13